MKKLFLGSFLLSSLLGGMAFAQDEITSSSLTENGVFDVNFYKVDGENKTLIHSYKVDLNSTEFLASSGYASKVEKETAYVKECTSSDGAQVLTPGVIKTGYNSNISRASNNNDNLIVSISYSNLVSLDSIQSDKCFIQSAKVDVFDMSIPFFRKDLNMDYHFENNLYRLEITKI